LLAVDEQVGALLIEAIDPGTPLDETTRYPRLDELAALITSLQSGPPDPSYPVVAERVSSLFDAGLKNYERRPDLAAVVPPELYARGRLLATWLASDPPRTTLLHGDLTPANVLVGGTGRGLVAIDPAPCLGDPAFDTVDLLFWRAADAQTVHTRAERLAPAVGADPARVAAWCAAFAAMTALEVAEAPDPDAERVQLFVALARDATR
jgi:streptomycin 6-kinase